MEISTRVAGSGRQWIVLAGLALLVGAAFPTQGIHAAQGQAAHPESGSTSPQLAWIDTDIGDDIDDAFALGLILRSPELKVLGISTAFGDTETRARLVDRFLAATGATGIPVTAGVHTETDNPLTQRAYADHFPARKHADGVVALLAAIRQHPGQITLIAIGPLFNIGAAIDRDPVTFKKLKRVVMMGGSVRRGYDGKNGETRPAEPEWNIDRDPKDASKLLAAGVPIFMAPLDSTQIHLPPVDREALFATGNPLTDQLTLLYHQWAAHSWDHSPTPTLFDPLAAAYTFRPDLCPMQPMRLAVDDKGLTTEIAGEPNAQVCLKSGKAQFLQLLESRIAPEAKATEKR
jgi:inosine-uridine nucleoside N-ribohydrolase